MPINPTWVTHRSHPSVTWRASENNWDDSREHVTPKKSLSLLNDGSHLLILPDERPQVPCEAPSMSFYEPGNSSPAIPSPLNTHIQVGGSSLISVSWVGKSFKLFYFQTCNCTPCLGRSAFTSVYPRLRFCLF